MNDVEFYDSGFDGFQDLLEEYAQKADNAIDIIEVGAKALVEDVRRLPQPRSRMNKPVHLLDSVTYKKKKDEIETGWGFYYGPMVERGTRYMDARAHITPTFNANKEKYYSAIQRKFNEI